MLVVFLMGAPSLELWLGVFLCGKFESEYVLPQKSIQGHICEIMEGGQEAFNLHKHKYNI